MIRALSTLVVVVSLTGCEESAPETWEAPKSVPQPPLTAEPTGTASAAAPEKVPDRIAAQHVLIAYRGAKNAPPEVKRSKAEAKKLAEEVHKKASDGEKFADLAKEHSDDAESAARLGSVGTFAKEKMHEKFSEAAFALKVNEISAVVETPFGFHVIKRNQ